MATRPHLSHGLISNFSVHSGTLLVWHFRGGIAPIFSSYPIGRVIASVWPRCAGRVGTGACYNHSLLGAFNTSQGESHIELFSIRCLRGVYAFAEASAGARDEALMLTSAF